jgi:predicted oxidoreductase
MHAMFAQSASALSMVIPIVAITLGIGYAIVKTVVRAIQETKQSEHVAIIKQQMLDRGMSADDIAKVVNAGVHKPGHKM